MKIRGYQYQLNEEHGFFKRKVIERINSISWCIVKDMITSEANSTFLSAKQLLFFLLLVIMINYIFDEFREWQY